MTRVFLSFKTEHKTTTAVIPEGLTKKLQPLDISVIWSFKNHVCEEWEKWMSEGIHTFHRNWKDEKGNTRGSLQLGNSSGESSETHGNHEWLQESTPFTETGKMRRATHREVCNWVIRVGKAVKFTAIMNGFRKAGITSVPGASEDDVSDASEISDDEQSTATLDPVLDVQLIDLFHSDTEDKDFDSDST